MSGMAEGDFRGYNATVLGAYWNSLSDPRVRAQHDEHLAKLKAAHVAVEDVYNETPAGFDIEDVLGEVVESLCDAITDLTPPGERPSDEEIDGDVVTPEMIAMSTPRPESAVTCASCGHPEVDHHGLSCGAYDETSFGYERCKCDGFVSREEDVDGGD